MRISFASCLLIFVPVGVAYAEESPILLPAVTTYSPRVANQEPVASFAMPVSSLRFEPLLDLQSRNAGEAQADVTIRGGIFENTGFRIGGVSLYDPQTGHYFAEIPVAPAMLGEPQVLTGTDNALKGFNADVGTVAYAWRPITTRGEAQLGFGDHDLMRQSVYQGYVSPLKVGEQALAADVEYSHSSGNGTQAFGDHRFSRINARLQLAGGANQTDLFFGYQSKFFGWPNLYTPFGVHETENLQTGLFALNHRINLAGGDYIEAGLFYRRNKDDYEYSRETPGLYNPYLHTTWARGAAVSGRVTTFDAIAVNYSAEVLTDNLRSTSLVYGTFSSRTYGKVAVVPEKTWRPAGGPSVTAKAGITYDDTDRDASALSPLAEIALDFPDRAERLYVSYAKTTQVPTYTALNSSPTSGLFRGNAHLGRESAHNLELGWRRPFGRWSLQSAVFYRFDRNLVDWTYAYSSPAARKANPVDIDTLGFEGVARYDAGALSLVLGYTWLDKDADYRGATVDASFYALNYATHRLTAAVIVRLGGGVEIRMDNVARIQKDNRLRAIGGDEALISSLGVYLRPHAIRGLELAALVDNLWNSNFQEVPAVPASRRQLSLQAGYAW